MKDMKQIYIPVLIFVGLILLGVALSYGDFKSRHNLGYYGDTANNDFVILNASTFTKVLDVNEDRIYAVFCNDSQLNEDEKIYINYRTVAESVDETGLIIWGGKCETMHPYAPITNEISAIASQGTPRLTYIEY